MVSPHEGAFADLARNGRHTRLGGQTSTRQRVCRTVLLHGWLTARGWDELLITGLPADVADVFIRTLAAFSTTSTLWLGSRRHRSAAVALTPLTRVTVSYGVAYDAGHDAGEALRAAYGFRTTSGVRAAHARLLSTRGERLPPSS